METNCSTNPKPKTIKDFLKSWYLWKPFLGIIVGGLGGFLFFYSYTRRTGARLCREINGLQGRHRERTGISFSLWYPEYSYFAFYSKRGKTAVRDGGIATPYI